MPLRKYNIYPQLGIDFSLLVRSFAGWHGGGVQGKFSKTNFIERRVLLVREYARRRMLVHGVH
jgi:hypothetical protein